MCDKFCVLKMDCSNQVLQVIEEVKSCSCRCVLGRQRQAASRHNTLSERKRGKKHEVLSSVGLDQTAWRNGPKLTSSWTTPSKIMQSTCSLWLIPPGYKDVPGNIWNSHLCHISYRNSLSKIKSSFFLDCLLCSCGLVSYTCLVVAVWEQFYILYISFQHFSSFIDSISTKLVHKNTSSNHRNSSFTQGNVFEYFCPYFIDTQSIHNLL